MVSSRRERTTDRILKGDYKASLPEGVWVDQFLIVMKDICMFQKKEGENERREVTLPFDLNVRVEMFGMAKQYAIQHPSIDFDPQMKINVYMAPMII
jgi:hypothetical protein